MPQHNSSLPLWQQWWWFCLLQTCMVVVVMMISEYRKVTKALLLNDCMFIFNFLKYFTCQHHHRHHYHACQAYLYSVTRNKVSFLLKTHCIVLFTESLKNNLKGQPTYYHDGDCGVDYGGHLQSSRWYKNKIQIFYRLLHKRKSTLLSATKTEREG